MTVFTGVRKERALSLLQKGFKKETLKTIHEQLRLKKGDLTLILYNSGKLLLQGKKEEVGKATELLVKLGIGEKEEGIKFKQEQGWIIGSDESLKGDTFGGLVVAAVKADEKARKQLVELGVADSKTLEDKEILPLAEKIRKMAACEIKTVLPEEYNHHGHSITQLLNTLHKHCAEYLKPGKHIVDKYPGCTVGEVQEEKADSKYVEVAAASILARAGALQQLDYLSALAGFIVPKGSTHVKGALEELKKRKLEFRKFVKVDFRNVREFL